MLVQRVLDTEDPIIIKAYGKKAREIEAPKTSPEHPGVGKAAPDLALSWFRVQLGL